MIPIELSTIWILVAAGLAHILLCKLYDEVSRRTLNLLIALDQLAYVLLTLGAGHPDETLSAAAYRTERKKPPAGRHLSPTDRPAFLAIRERPLSQSV